MLNPLKDLNPSSEELKLQNYLQKKDVLKAIKSCLKNFDDIKPKINFSKSKIEEIRKKFNESRYKFSKSKINAIRRNTYEIENKKNLSVPQIKKIEKNLLKLEKNLFKSKKYYDYDDSELKE